ncbi:hypothetical protein FJZ31_16775 [Candidatus Poribacteria bacterium]|nr:hypothetical protein [Candidatus Poribacteria bacterium]
MRRVNPNRQLQLTLGLPAFTNSGLFVDHFLKHRLPELDEWKSDDGVNEAYKAIQQLYKGKAASFTYRTDEAQAEDDFSRPVLNLLWGKECYQVQVSIPNEDARRQTDYAFFRSAVDRQAAQPRLGKLDYWRDVPTLGDYRTDLSYSALPSEV